MLLISPGKVIPTCTECTGDICKKVNSKDYLHFTAEFVLAQKAVSQQAIFAI